MKTITTIVIFLLLATPIGAAQTTEPPVKWFDDFLGIRLNPAYSISLAGNGVVEMAPAPGGGGMAMLAALGYGMGVARLRLGEDPVTGPPFNALNFSAQKNLVYKSRVFLNRNTEVYATIGFVGHGDPDNVLAAVFDGNSWGFQVANERQAVTMPTGFIHQPGAWFTVKIETVWSENPIARIYINDDSKPLVTVEGAYVPVGGLTPEFQLWNLPLESDHSQPTLYIDYLSVTQDR